MKNGMIKSNTKLGSKFITVKNSIIYENRHFTRRLHNYKE